MLTPTRKPHLAICTQIPYKSLQNACKTFLINYNKMIFLINPTFDSIVYHVVNVINRIESIYVLV